jgi:myo-inositol-1(or 4)-monophosphatase
MKQTLLAALKDAGEELLKHFGKPVDSSVKESQSSIVTKADLKSDALIVKLITEHFPSHNILSEESGYTFRNSKYTWVIDPLDGTSNFASALPWFGILIALFENNIPIMGGAYLPVQDLLYFAEKNKGAFKNGKPFIMERNTELKNSLFSFNVDFTDDEIVLNSSIGIYKNLVKAVRNIRSTNSLVDFLYVAEGKFGGCVNLFTRIWDISALGLIISEAGGVMKDIKGNDIQFILNESVVLKNFPVMVGSEEIIKEIRRVVL